MRFESTRDRVVDGYTRDVSSSGAFLESDGDLFEAIHEGEEGVVFLRVQKGENHYEISFPCVVARITDEGIALNFEAESED